MNTNTVPEISLPGLNLLPHSWQGPLLIFLVLSPMVGRFITGLKAGGGIKGAAMSIWMGSSTANPNPPTKS
jgi:hypothetical protein